MDNFSKECVDTSPFGDVIFTYTRAQALEDGVLIDASALAQQAGFVLPVAITAQAFADCVAWREADNLAQVHQDETARLWDVLFMAAHAARSSSGSGSCTLFELYRVPKDGHSADPAPVRLKLVVGPDDHGGPVATILLDGED